MNRSSASWLVDANGAERLIKDDEEFLRIAFWQPTQIPALECELILLPRLVTEGAGAHIDHAFALQMRDKSQIRGCRPIGIPSSKVVEDALAAGRNPFDAVLVNCPDVLAAALAQSDALRRFYEQHVALPPR